MNKFLLTIILALAGMSCNAQIYNMITHYDKFDDIIHVEEHKTLISQTDSTFIVEVKGKAPVTYIILNPVEDGTLGTKESPVNLVDNVYGYQETWCVVRSDMIEKYKEALINFALNKTEDNVEKVSKCWLFVVQRTTTNKYTGEYEHNYFWIQDEKNDGKLGKNVNRIVYASFPY